MRHLKSTLSDQVKVLRARLTQQLRETRERLLLTQDELGKRLGVSRVTVHRLESEAADPQLSTFLGAVLACGLDVELQEPSQEPASRFSAPERLKHRGLSYFRTQHDLGSRDRQRERALAKAWEAANKYQAVGLQPILPSLIPGGTQEQATACATVVQWLGSEVGFDFLKQALRNAGYDIVEQRSGS
jgi:DNA-binding XRE family transcriptional regulator